MSLFYVCGYRNRLSVLRCEFFLSVVCCEPFFFYVYGSGYCYVESFFICGFGYGYW